MLAGLVIAGDCGYLDNGKGYSCSIDSGTSNYWSTANTKIYAIEGMNDVYLTGWGFYDQAASYVGTYLYCGDDYSNYCELDNNVNNNNIICQSGIGDGTLCENYLLPNDDYIAINSALTWSDAESYCHTYYNTSLATIRGSYENGVARRIGDSVFGSGLSFWIGLNDINNESIFKWADGSDINYYNYTNWNSGEPNDYNNNEDCIEMTSNGKWNDNQCSNSLQFLCNNDTTSSPSPSPTRIPTSSTQYPSQSPTMTPSLPSESPTFAPTLLPSSTPSYSPSQLPTVEPTTTPSNTPTQQPSQSPTYHSNYDYIAGPTTGLFYLNAEEYCQLNYYSSLATIKNSYENEIVRRIADQAFGGGIIIWIGLNDINNEGIFKWADSSNITNYTNWNSGEPNNYNDNEDCVEMNGYGYWNDYPCSSLGRQFVCNNGTSESPTESPSIAPSQLPTQSPTIAPSLPSIAPTESPVQPPTIAPSNAPSYLPSQQP